MNILPGPPCFSVANSHYAKGKTPDRIFCGEAVAQERNGPTIQQAPNPTIPQSHNQTQCGPRGQRTFDENIPMPIRHNDTVRCGSFWRNRKASESTRFTHCEDARKGRVQDYKMEEIERRCLKCLEQFTLRQLYRLDMMRKKVLTELG